MKLTEFSIRALSVEKGQRIFFDDTFKGFGVRVSQGGAKSYILVTGKERKHVTLGRVDRLGLKDAREKARGILHAPKSHTPTLTFQAALNAFLAMRVRPNNKVSTAQETERLLTRHFAPLYEKPIASLKTGDFLAMSNALITAGKPSEANHAFTAVKTMLRWSRGQGCIERHPLEDATRPYKPVSRDRWLNGHEIAKLLATEPGAPYPGLLKALLYTGQRLGQLNPFNPDWIEGNTVRFPASAMKSGHEHTIPTTETTRDILTSLTLIRSWGVHTKFLEASGLVPFTRHDLRRSYSTGLAQLGIAPHIIERLLDHQGGTINGVAATYNRYSFMAEMREAVERWESHLSRLTGTC